MNKQRIKQLVVKAMENSIKVTEEERDITALLDNLKEAINQAEKVGDTYGEGSPGYEALNSATKDIKEIIKNLRFLI